MNTEESMDEKQSLRLIHYMMEVSARNLQQDGQLILAWGAAIVIGRFLTFFPEVKLLSKQLMFLFDVLSWLIGIAIIVYTIYYVFIYRKGTKSYVAKTAAYTWLGILIVHNLMVMFIKQKTGEVNFELLHPIQMILIGLALFITGGLYRERLFLLGGIVYWLAAYFGLPYRLPAQMIFEAVAALIGFVIPGTWLYYQSQKNVPTP
jgi:hypothetical protein